MKNLRKLIARTRTSNAAAPDPLASRPMNMIQRLIVTALVLVVGGSTFRLSYDAQLTLAVASGIDPEIAGLYPIGVDVALMLGYLLLVWVPALSQTAKAGILRAIIFWTVTNVLGNAFHIIALPEGRIEIPLAVAIAVNTVPAVTLLIVFHLATIPTKNSTPTTTALAEGPQRSPKPSVSTAPAPSRQDLPVIPIETLVEMNEVQQLSTAKIAERVGRSKSWVAAQLANHRKLLAGAEDLKLGA